MSPDIHAYVNTQKRDATKFTEYSTHTGYLEKGSKYGSGSRG